MRSNLLDILRIGIFYDGYYFYKVSNYYKYEHEKKSRISISGLHEFIRNEVAVMTGADMRQCQIIDAHYFKGRSSAKDLGEKVQAERVFEDILMRENIVSHYLPLRYGENNIAQEKGIDVWLALEAYELAIYKHFDVLVLVAGDGDYVPLVRKLHTLGTQVMLISWDFSYHNDVGDLVETKTSRQLTNEVFYAVQMAARVEQSDTEFVRELFVTERPYQGYGGWGWRPFAQLASQGTGAAAGQTAGAAGQTAGQTAAGPTAGGAAAGQTAAGQTAVGQAIGGAAGQTAAEPGDDHQNSPDGVPRPTPAPADLPSAGAPAQSPSAQPPSAQPPSAPSSSADAAAGAARVEKALPELEREFVSTIFSLNMKGFGFIRDDERNNIFFHYSRVANRDFDELQTGMRVLYTLEEDPERSRREERPCFRANKVTVLD